MPHYSNICRIDKIKPKTDSIPDFFLSGPEDDWEEVEIESRVYKKVPPKKDREGTTNMEYSSANFKQNNEYSEVTDRDYYRFVSLVKSYDEMNLENILKLSSQINPKYSSKLRDERVFLASNGKIEPAIIFPEASKVKQKLQDLCKYVNDNPDNLDRIELASAFAYGFCLIHPFLDGNGRTSRILPNYFLNKNEVFTPLKTDREDYRIACHGINVTGDLNSMYNYFIKRLN